MKNTAKALTIEDLGRSQLQQAARAEELQRSNDSAGQVTVGRGYNIFGRYGSQLSVAASVLDYDALAQDGMISVTNLEFSETRIFEGSSMEALSQSLETHANASVGFGGFAASVSSSFSQSVSRRKEFEYATLMKLALKRRVAVINLDLNELKSYIVQDAKDQINDPNIDPDGLIDVYGTHVLVDALFGGRFEHHFAANRLAISSATSMSAAVEASFSFARGEGGFASTEERDSFLSNSSQRTLAEGGNATIVSGPADLEAWSQSINDDNAILVDFSEIGRPLIPIWEFADAPARQNAIRDAVLEDARAAQQLLLDEPMQLKVDLKFQVLDDRDEGPKLELYGTQSIEKRVAQNGSEIIVDAKTLFKRSANDSFTVGKGHPVNPPGPQETSSEHIFAFKPEEDINTVSIKLIGNMRERDPGSSGDDSLGHRDIVLRLGRDRVLGTQKLHHHQGAKLDAIYEISLVE